jgi:hypothetical protein
MAAGGTKANVDLGPGRLYYAPLGTAEPTSASAPLPSAWQAVGYTEDGTAIATDITSEMVEVAEELDPIRYVQTRRASQLTVQMAEATVKRLALALGAGATVTDDGTSFEFPAPGAIVGVMFVWDRDETPSATNRRWIMRQATPSGSIEISNRKAPQKRLIPVTFDLSLPDGATSPVKVFPNPSGLI